MTAYANPQWADADQTELDVDWSGQRIRIKANPTLLHFRAILAAGLEIAPMPVTAAKAHYSRKIDEDAEAVRLRYLTPGSGMAQVYQEKFAQALRVSTMGAQEANALSIADREAQFPTLAASVGIERATLYECAELVLEKYAQFAALSLPIESARLAGKRAVAKASDLAGVRAAYEAIAWPTP